MSMKTTLATTLFALALSLMFATASAAETGPTGDQGAGCAEQSKENHRESVNDLNHALELDPTKDLVRPWVRDQTAQPERLAMGGKRSEDGGALHLFSALDD